ncbi:MAG TPA: hypothetical protein VD835_15295 [Pyrinomonadaceae bacterium]|nr:hypothetical protein [Pyrinomonadaceae bacterium]
MADFGNDGTRTVTVSENAVEVMLSDPQKKEHLHYFITAAGGTPIFNLSCRHTTLWTEETFGSPAMNYERVWPLTPGEVDDQNDPVDDVYVVSFSFLHVNQYTLVVERHDAKHKVLETIKRIKYTSNNPSDKFSEFFTVGAR